MKIKNKKSVVELVHSNIKDYFHRRIPKSLIAKYVNKITKTKNGEYTVNKIDNITNKIVEDYKYAIKRDYSVKRVKKEVSYNSLNKKNIRYLRSNLKKQGLYNAEQETKLKLLNRFSNELNIVKTTNKELYRKLTLNTRVASLNDLDTYTSLTNFLSNISSGDLENSTLTLLSVKELKNLVKNYKKLLNVVDKTTEILNVNSLFNDTFEVEKYTPNYNSYGGSIIYDNYGIQFSIADISQGSMSLEYFDYDKTLVEEYIRNGQAQSIFLDIYNNMFSQVSPSGEWKIREFFNGEYDILGTEAYNLARLLEWLKGNI